MLGGLAAGAATGLLVAALHLLAERHLRAAMLGMLPGGGWTLSGLAVLCQLVPPRLRPALWAVSGALFAAAMMRLSAVPLLAFALAIAALSRPRGALGLRLAAAALLWASLPAARWLLPGAAWPQDLPPAPLVMVWGGLAYSSLYLLVEHRRSRPGALGWVDDLAYLLAPPRLVTPFFQPISPTLFKERTCAMTPLRLGRTVGLILWGAAVAAVSGALLYRPVPHGSPLRFPATLVGHYVHLASGIFLAVALFRCLGCDLPSGFRQPFRARSFADFFRRWNHYVRDSVLSLFYFPFLGTLRRWLPKRATEILSAYLAIFCGSFLLNDFLVPMATTPDFLDAWHRATRPGHLLGLLAYWSAIVLPRSSLFFRPREQRELKKQEASFELWPTLKFLAIFVGLHLALFALGRR